DPRPGPRRSRVGRRRGAPRLVPASGSHRRARRGDHCTMSRARQLLAATAGAAALLATATTAHAAVVGLADQQPGSFADPLLQALGLRYARLTVPWDAATSEPQAVATWLAAV